MRLAASTSTHSPPIQRQARQIGILMALTCAFPPLAVWAIISIVLSGLAGFFKHSWRGLIWGLVLTTLLAVLAATLPVLAFLSIGLFLFVLARRWAFFKRYKTALWLGLRLHLALLCIGGLGTWAGYALLEWFQLPEQSQLRHTVQQHLQHPELQDGAILTGIFALWLWGCVLLSRLTALTWQRTLAPLTNDPHVVPLNALAPHVAAAAPVMLFLLVLPLLKFDGILFSDHLSGLVDAMDGHDDPQAMNHNDTSSSTGTHHVRPYTRHTADGLEVVQGHERGNPDGNPANNLKPPRHFG